MDTIANRVKVLINGYEYWVDKTKMVVYENDQTNNGSPVRSSHLTQDERRQLLDYLKYGR